MNSQGWKQRVGHLKSETHAMYFAYKDPRVPWYARVFAALVAGYVFSPVDPIPDFIPVVGLLDELIVVPVGLAIARKIIPDQVMVEAHEKAKGLESQPVNRKATVVIVSIWLLIVALAIVLAVRPFG